MPRSEIRTTDEAGPAITPGNPLPRAAAALLLTTSIILLLAGAAHVLSPAACFAQEAGDRAVCEPSRPAGARECPFLANEGQMDDRVAFRMAAQSGPVFVTRDSDIVYSLRGRANGGGSVALAIMESLAGGARSLPAAGESSPVSVSWCRGDDPSLWRSSVGAYRSVDLGEVYDGIRAELRAGEGNVEKVFRVAPGADPDEIQVVVTGAERVAVGDDGRLVISTSLGDVSFTRPVAYQERDGLRESVDVAYRVDGSSYGFELGTYDADLDLVIDPLLSSTFMGGSDIDGGYCGNAVALGPDGSVYVTGFTASGDFPRTIGDLYHGGASDVFVSRLNPTMTGLIASVFIGGVDDEEASSIVVDASSNVYISGGTTSSDFPTTTGAYDTTYAGGVAGPYSVPGDVFVTKLSGDLSSIVSSTYFGGARYDYSRAIVLDGDVYITGATGSSGLATAGAFDETRNTAGDWGGIDAYVARFDPTLSSLVAASYAGGGGFDFAEDMAASPLGGVVITGWTGSADFPTSPSAYDTIFEGGVYDAFVTRFDAGLGSLAGSSYLGGTSWDFGYGMDVDAAGNVYVTGHAAELGAETTFPTTAGCFDPDYNGIGGPNVGDDGFVSKFDATMSNLLASTMLGGTGWEYGNGLKWDPDGYVCVVGATSSEDFPRHEGAFQYDYGGDTGSTHNGDAFVSRLSDDLTSLAGGTYLGGSGDDRAEYVVLDSTGNIFVTGTAGSSDFPTSDGAYREGYVGGTNDAFVSALSSDLGGTAFTAFPNTGLPPVAVSLSGESDADPPPTAWLWDVDDDGDTDTTGQTAFWTYASPGLYSIRLETTLGVFSPSVTSTDCVWVFDESAALRFDGEDSYASCPPGSGIDLAGPMTVEAWINPTTWGGFPFAEMGMGHVVSKGSFSVFLSGVHFSYNDHCLCVELKHSDGTTSVSFTPDDSLVLGSWRKVSVTYDPATSTLRMWIDGTEQAVSSTVAPSGPLADNSGDDLIIGNSADLARDFEGDIDELSLWNVVRSDGDIEGGVESPLSGDEPGLVAYWRMNDGNGEVASDETSGGHDASLSGPEWVQGVLLTATGISGWAEPGEENGSILVTSHPNPFGPAGSMAFHVRSEGPAAAAVYDVSGRLVRTLAGERTSESVSRFVWDGTDDSGRPAASGVYFCRLTSGRSAETAKVTLIR